jgi:hypothetical protein
MINRLLTTTKYREQEYTGDQKDIQHSTIRVMNKAASSRLISKQEAVVLLGQLDLVLCSETIESVSISNSKRLTIESDVADGSILQQYINRPAQFENMCLQDYFCHIKNVLKPTGIIIIPHFIGINGSPCFPVNDNYAKQCLIIYRPWRIYPTSKNWQQEFNYFINLRSTPVSCKLTYHRVMQRWYDKMAGYEPTAAKMDYSKNSIPEDIQVLLDLTGLSCNDITEFDDAMLRKIDRGLDFEWDRDSKVSLITHHVSINFDLL